MPWLVSDIVNVGAHSHSISLGKRAEDLVLSRPHDSHKHDRTLEEQCVYSEPRQSCAEEAGCAFGAVGQCLGSHRLFASDDPMTIESRPVLASTWQTLGSKSGNFHALSHIPDDVPVAVLSSTAASQGHCRPPAFSSHNACSNFNPSMQLQANKPYIDSNIDSNTNAPRSSMTADNLS